MTKRAFTLVELLVVIAIIGVLVALLLPAVQMAREAARRTSCVNNLKQLALAVHGYHDTYNYVPSLYNGSLPAPSPITFGLEAFGWHSVVLPYTEESALFESIDFDLYPTAAANAVAVNTTRVIANCPSTPREWPVARGLWTGRGKFEDSLSAATTDYPSCDGYMQGMECIAGVWGEAKPAMTLGDPPMVLKVSFSKVTDGLSSTLLIVERAALPNHYFDGGNTVEPHEPPKFRTWGNVGLWAISGEMMLNHLQEQPGVPIVNGDNLHGMYSFHPGGAHAAVADGAVRFVKDSIEAETLFALISRNQGEIVDTDALR